METAHKWAGRADGERMGGRSELRGAFRNPGVPAGIWIAVLSAVSMLVWSGIESAFSSTTGTGSNSLALASLTAPDPLSCAWTGTNSVQLTWTQVGAPADGYQYERSDTLASGYTVLGTTSGLPSVTATDTNPAPPTVRYYRAASTLAGSWVSPYATSVATSSCAKAITSLFSAGTVTGPFGVAVDAAGNVYTASTSTNTVVKTTTAGVTTTVAGTGTAGYAGDGAAATSALLNAPRGLVVDASGNLYICDDGNFAVRKVTAGGTISTFAGTGISGYTGDGGQATSAKLKGAGSAFLDSSGNFYIADQNAHVVRKVTSGGVISTIAGTGTAGYTGDGGAATSATLDNPYGVVVDSSGRIFISDTTNNVIRRVSGGTITTVAGGGANAACSFSGAGTSVQLAGPRRLAYDPASSRVFIADRDNQCVRALSTSGNTISQVAGTSTVGYTGDNGPAVAATLSNPGAVALSSSGDLYIADANNNVVRKVLKV